MLINPFRWFRRRPVPAVQSSVKRTGRYLNTSTVALIKRDLAAGISLNDIAIRHNAGISAVKQ